MAKIEIWNLNVTSTLMSMVLIPEPQGHLLQDQPPLKTLGNGGIPVLHIPNTAQGN